MSASNRSVLNSSARSLRRFNRQFSSASDSVSCDNVDLQKLKENYVHLTIKYDKMMKANSRLSNLTLSIGQPNGSAFAFDAFSTRT